MAGVDVERGLFTAYKDAAGITTRHARYPARVAAVKGEAEAGGGI